MMGTLVRIGRPILIFCSGFAMSNFRQIDRGRHEGSETECLGGLEVDRQFELYWGLNRKLAHFVTPQDAI